MICFLVILKHYTADCVKPLYLLFVRPNSPLRGHLGFSCPSSSHHTFPSTTDGNSLPRPVPSLNLMVTLAEPGQLDADVCVLELIWLFELHG